MPDSSPRSRADAATRRWVERLERFAAGNHTVVAFCAAECVPHGNDLRIDPGGDREDAGGHLI